jgi:hypothetical protein
MRTHLICPATVLQVKAWTDAGTPVMIAWNPEGRPWSHASVVFDVTEGDEGKLIVHVADPNIPNPSQTVREVDEDTFYSKWSEKWPKYLVRRPAMAVEREISSEGRQMVASDKTAREIYVDEQGYAHDDEGNSWFVGQQYGPKTYSGFSGRFLTRMAPREPARRPQTPASEMVPLSESDRTDLRNLVLALHADPRQDVRSSKFIRDIQHKQELTAKQDRWFRSLQKRYRRFLDRIPGRINVTYKPDGRPWYVTITNPAVEKWVTQTFSTAPRIAPGHTLELIGPPGRAASIEERAMVEESMMDRASQLLWYMSEREAIKHLMDDGMNRSDAYLAVKAGKLLNKQRGKRMKRRAGVDPPYDQDGLGPIYPNEIDHGYDQPISGGHDIMKRIQNEFVYEQGRPDWIRPENPRLAGEGNMVSIDTLVTRFRRLATKEARHPEGEEMTMEEVTEDMDPGEKKRFRNMNKEHGDKFKKKSFAEVLDFLRREARHPEGEEMSIEEVTEDMSPEEKKKFKGMNKEYGDKFKKEARAPGGLYGYTKKIQRDCQGAGNRLARKAMSMARRAYKKDEKVASFWKTHGQRAKSNTARILSGALKSYFSTRMGSDDEPIRTVGYGDPVEELVPQSEIEKMARIVSVKDVFDIYEDVCLDDSRDRKSVLTALTEAVAKKKGLNPSDSRDSTKVRDIEKRIETILKRRDECLEDARVRRSLTSLVSRVGSYEDPERLAELREIRKTAAYSMYGFPTGTVRLALSTCANLKEEAGRIAYDLNQRRAACHEQITGFLKNHSKYGRCRYSRLLHACYPEARARTASEAPKGVDEWIYWEE